VVNIFKPIFIDEDLKLVVKKLLGLLALYLRELFKSSEGLSVKDMTKIL
jgi:hypothetical protein